ncbi:MAG TPA: DUF1499 domain-containing protein [Candidatus Binataceae bacterium]|nr:DUF1499 domain-containing protein [Candidatus Binataceae bacterium]
MAPEWLAFYDGIIALVAVSVGLVGAHFGLMSPMVGFSLVFFWGFMLSLIGTTVGLFARYRFNTPQTIAKRNRATVGLVMSIVVAIPVGLTIAHGFMVKSAPINDITTDFDNPPEFVHAKLFVDNAGRDLKYDKAKFAARQESTYGIVAPLKERLAPKDAFQRVQEIAARIPAWKVTYTDAATMTLEAVAFSSIFRFPDDVIVQVRPSSDGGSLIEMRSKSRFGVGDLGVNHRRINRFFDRMAMARGEPGSADIP